MTNLQAIDNRISRRSYLNTPIEKEKLNALVEIITKTNILSGLNSIFVKDSKDCFNSVKGYGMFAGVNSLIVLKGDKDLPHLKEKVGYYGEIILLEATKMGLATCWVGATYNTNSSVLCCSEDEEVVCVIPIGYAKKDQTLRENIIRTGARRKTKNIEDMIVTYSEIPEWFYTAMGYVGKAPTAKNSQKSIFTIDENSEITAHIADDYYLDLVDLGICKLHFELSASGKFDLGNYGKWVKGEH